MRKLNLALLAGLTVLFATSCGTGDQPKDTAMKNTITIQEANQRVEDYAERARAAFPVSAELRLQSQFKDSPCDDPTDNGPKGRLVASRGYQVMGPSVDQFPQQFEAIQAWWGQNGFAVSTDSARGADRTVAAENKADGFTMSLRSNNVGQLYLNTSSPCVWRNGTPESAN
ncbi:hypothetical protein [Amycolatopsis sp. NPDC051071]|uniref:hypothetical protein n=1 Tax=Amycolatopsis sp. NPDC051071 TaxID=3154637 RepID=UPI003436F8D1